MLALPDLLAYHDWANGRYLAALADLPDADWRRDLGSSFPSVQATTAHLVGAEWVWLRRWQGESPTERPPWLEDASPAGLRAALSEIEAERTALVARDDPGCLVRYRLFNGSAGADPLGALVQHVVHHAAYHRGQLATLLRQLGHAPPPTDLLVFLRERAE